MRSHLRSEVAPRKLINLTGGKGNVRSSERFFFNVFLFLIHPSFFFALKSNVSYRRVHFENFFRENTFVKPNPINKSLSYEPVRIANSEWSRSSTIFGARTRDITISRKYGRSIHTRFENVLWSRDS